MPGLVDLVLPKRTKTLYGVEVRITGVDADAVGALWDRFPKLADAAASGQFGVREILALGPEVTAAFIAAGTGAAGDPAAEAIARDLNRTWKVVYTGAVDCALWIKPDTNPNNFTETLTLTLEAEVQDHRAASKDAPGKQNMSGSVST